MTRFITTVPTASMPSGLERLDSKYITRAMQSLDDMAKVTLLLVEVIAPDYEGFGPGGLLEDLKLAFTTVYSDFRTVGGHVAGYALQRLAPPVVREVRPMSSDTWATDR